MAWALGFDHHCHCLLYKVARREEVLDFGKLLSRTQLCLCFLGILHLTQDSVLLLKYVHFNIVWFQK